MHVILHFNLQAIDNNNNNNNDDDDDDDDISKYKVLQWTDLKEQIEQHILLLENSYCSKLRISWIVRQCLYSLLFFPNMVLFV